MHRKLLHVFFEKMLLESKNIGASETCIFYLSFRQLASNFRLHPRLMLHILNYIPPPLFFFFGFSGSLLQSMGCLLPCIGYSLVVVPRASHCISLSSSGTWALGYVGLAVSSQVGSSRNMNWTHVPCTGRRILNHWTTREGPGTLFL